jgi:hypothetical protein
MGLATTPGALPGSMQLRATRASRVSACNPTEWPKRIGRRIGPGACIRTGMSSHCAIRPSSQTDFVDEFDFEDELEGKKVCGMEGCWNGCEAPVVASALCHTGRAQLGQAGTAPFPANDRCHSRHRDRHHICGSLRDELVLGCQQGRLVGFMIGLWPNVDPALTVILADLWPEHSACFLNRCRSQSHFVREIA